MNISGTGKAGCCIVLLMTVAATCAAAERVEGAGFDQNASPRQTSLSAPPVVKETYEYYEIKGNSEDQLRSEMCRNGCKWKDGKIYDSITSWHVKWAYDYDRSPDTCSAKSFKVFVDVAFRYPKWVRTDDVPGQLVAKWDRYMNSLVEHETGHRDMAVEAAAELARDVAGLPPAPTCEELDRAVKSLCRERLNRLNDGAKEYDEATRHGSVQGAIFP
jgi:predicted secreted Zn-dependent protease